MLNESEVASLKERLRDRAVDSRPKLTPERRAELVRRFIETPGLSVRQLAQEFGVTHQSAWYLLRKACG